MTYEPNEYEIKMEEIADGIKTREDLADYLEYLARGYRTGEFEEQSVADYLDGAAGVLDGLEGWCMNSGRELPDQPDWEWMGTILTAAFAHS